MSQEATCQRQRLNFTLTPEQMRELEPIIKAGGDVSFIDAAIEGGKMSIAYIACNGTGRLQTRKI